MFVNSKCRFDIKQALKLENRIRMIKLKIENNVSERTYLDDMIKKLETESMKTQEANDEIQERFVVRFR